MDLQVYSGFCLNDLEISNLEKIRELRKPIHRDFANLVISDKSDEMTKSQRLKEEMAYFDKLSLTEDIIWKILHLTSQHFSSSVRIDLFKKAQGKKEYRKLMSESLLSFRKEQLRLFKSDPDNYTLPLKLS